MTAGQSFGSKMHMTALSEKNQPGGGAAANKTKSPRSKASGKSGRSERASPSRRDKSKSKGERIQPTIQPSLVPLDGDPTAAEDSAGQPLENRAVEELREGGEQESKPDDSKMQLMDGGEGGALLAEREANM